MEKQSSTNKSNAKENFVKPEELAPLVERIRDYLGVKETKHDDGSYSYNTEWKISDVHDEQGRQYVDLVQKGGGVWGIALIGFTYVLEELGVRFLRLAGTSAGAINTVLLAAIGKKSDKKSDRILELLADKDIFDFVDGHSFVRKIIDFILRPKGSFNSLKFISIIYVLLFLSSLLVLVSPLGNNKDLEFVAFLMFTLLLVIPLILIVLLLMLYRRLGQAGYGLNPGEDFLIWLRKVLREEKPPPNGAAKTKDYFSVDDLMVKVKVDAKLKLRNEEGRNLDGLNGDITVITSELVTENKIELPNMKDLFVVKGEKQPFDDVAEMVRASMAIPFFFESFYVRKLDRDSSVIEWNEHFRIEPPKECRFVDGGVLSNFPINVYFSSHITNPRLPTIGINLKEDPNAESGGKKGQTNEPPSSKWTFTTFVLKLFNASRNYYDKDFVLKDNVVSNSIADVIIKDIDWLHFGMTTKQKQDLFMQGVMAACEFLTDDKFVIEKGVPRSNKKGFDWVGYKKLRKSMVRDLKEEIDQNLQSTTSTNE